MRLPIVSKVGALAVLLATGLVAATAGDRLPANEAAPSGVRIGLIDSLFQDVPQAAVASMMKPFSAIMQSQTGVRGDLVPAGDLESLAMQLSTDKLQLGVFHGIEFAWARVKHPELRPLAICVNQDLYLHAALVVRVDNTAANVGQLEHQVLAIPQHSKSHCTLFLDKACKDVQKDVNHLFSRVTTPVSTEDALDDVVDKEAAVVVVDNVAYTSFKRRKPGRAAKLRVLATSEAFPTAVIAYRPGTLDDATLTKFREGLMGAGNNIMGQQMLTLWKLTAFAAVPTDYEQNLADIVKNYPPPSGNTK